LQAFKQRDRVVEVRLQVGAGLAGFISKERANLRTCPETTPEASRHHRRILDAPTVRHEAEAALPLAQKPAPLVPVRWCRVFHVERLVEICGALDLAGEHRCSIEHPAGCRPYNADLNCENI
jgi:hypothetical protein